MNNDDRNRQLATEPISRLLRQSAVPLILTMSASAIFAIFDAMFLGHAVGSIALSALTVCLPIIMLISAFGALCNVGVAGMIASCQSKGNQNQALKILGNTFTHYIVATIIVTASGYLLMTPLLRLTGASDTVLPLATQYMQIYLLAALPSYILQGLTSIMRTTGDSNNATRIQMSVIIFNLVLDTIFIFALGWGMRGAALATLLSNFAGAAVLIYRFSDGKRFVHFESKMFGYQKESAHKALQMGFTPFGISLGGCVIVTVLNQMLILFGGNDADTYLCAYMIVYCITQVLVKGTAGLGQATSSIAGFNYNKRLYNRVRSVLSSSLSAATIIMIVGYGLIAAFPNLLTIMFTSDMQVRDICATALRIGLCTFPFVAAQMMVVAFFQSIGKRQLSMFISLSRQMIFLLPMLILLPRMIGVEGVWWSMCLADIYSVAISWGLLWMVMKNMHESYETTDINTLIKPAYTEFTHLSNQSDTQQKLPNTSQTTQSTPQAKTNTQQQTPINKETETIPHSLNVSSLNEDQLRQLAEKLLQDKNSLQQQLEYKTTTDYLTGLLNRSAGENAVEKFLTSGQPGIFVMLDCDHFKSINDNISHEVGDIVLREVAKAIKETFTDDICFRLGGDEFAVCMKKSNAITNTEGEIDIEATFLPLKTRLQNVHVPELNSAITLSGGAVCFSSETSTFRDVYRKSDKALQESKKKYHQGVVCLNKEIL